MLAFAAFVCCHQSLWAQHISEQQAHDRVLQFLNGRSATHIRRAPANRELKAVPVEVGSIYAFNCEGGGFVIASGDERTLPVLGYSDSGSLDWEQMPENMRAWLKQYDDAIASLGDRTDFVDGTAQGDAGIRRIQSERMPVEPFIKTHWDQYAPYWDESPLYAGPRADLRGQRCLTGCAATAMAQILNYYQWPKTMPDGLSDYNVGAQDPVYDYQIEALPPVAFDWDNMLNDYRAWDPETGEYDDVGTEQQRHAVATLMRYCGQAVKMGYGPDGLGSSANPADYQLAYTNCFGYSAAISVYRHDYGIGEWEDIIYGELAARRPVHYRGDSDDGGHAFICDGYDGNGLFHINWGWNGKDDGYFALSVLNPYNNTSAGSGSSGSRYNEFKLRLTVRNQVYLLFKNMPLWQWIVNFLPLLAGWIIKLIFFARKGMGGAYIKAFAEGIRLCAANKDKRVDHSSVPLSQQLKTEGELIINTIRRIL